MDGKAYALTFGEELIAVFQAIQSDGDGVKFHVTSPSWYHGNLAAEWITRKMERVGQCPDEKQHEKVYPKWCRCGSRKRFRKLLMANGFSVKTADLWCDFVRTVRRIQGESFSYQEAWLSYVLSGIRCDIRDD